MADHDQHELTKKNNRLMISMDRKRDNIMAFRHKKSVEEHYKGQPRPEREKGNSAEHMKRMAKKIRHKLIQHGSSILK